MKHKAVTIKIPEELEFTSLALHRDTVTMEVSFNWKPIETICEASGVDVALFRDSPEDNVAGLIVAWYQRHVEEGGERDHVSEQILAEVVAEDHFGVASVQSVTPTKQ